MKKFNARGSVGQPDSREVMLCQFLFEVFGIHFETSTVLRVAFIVVGAAK